MANTVLAAPAIFQLYDQERPQLRTIVLITDPVFFMDMKMVMIHLGLGTFC